MSASPKIKRKDFLTHCGKAFLGLGLGVSCSRSGENKGSVSSAADSGAAESSSALDAPITPAYRRLGRAKIKVTEIGFGASRTMDPTLINYAIEAGINFIDTGRSYYNGQNQILVGKVIKGRRQQVVINSKIQPAGLDKMRKDLEISLKDLGTDYVDCLLIHGASKPEHIQSEEIKEFLSKAKEQGKVRTFGFSSHSNFIQLLKIAAQDQFHEVIMVPYNFLGSYTHMLGGSKNSWDSKALSEAINTCGKAGIDFIAMKGCSGGFMKDSQGRASYRAALKWILQNPYMKTTATAMGNFQEIEEDARAMGSGGLGQNEKALLERYASLYSASYCRMCDSCAGQCPSGVAVAEVNRLHMYAVGYGGDMAEAARNSYAALGRATAESCTTCENCTVRCAYGLPLGSKLKQAHELLSQA